MFVAAPILEKTGQLFNTIRGLLDLLGVAYTPRDGVLSLEARPPLVSSPLRGSATATTFTATPMETTKTLEARAGLGDADAAFRLGYRRAFGRAGGTATDWRHAVKWWTTAARAGHPRAEFYLGTCYDGGRGVRKNVARAMTWYKRAADQGEPVAQYNIGLGFRDGAGVPKNPRQAVAYFSRAAGQGDADAQRDLGFAYHEGLGVRRDHAEAATWYRRAARQGDAKAQWNLALCYEAGHGVALSRRQAAFWFRKAAAQGHTASQAALSVAAG